MVIEDKEKYFRIRQMMKDAKLDAILVRLPENVLYFSNWWPITGWGFALVFAEGEPILFVPNSESRFAQRRIIQEMREYEPDGNQSVISQLKKLDCAKQTLKIGIEQTYEGIAGTHLGYEVAVPNVPFFKLLKKNFPNWTLKDVIPLITQMRSIKTEFDFQNLKLVNDINAYGITAASDAVSEGVSEVSLASITEKAINEKIGEYPEIVNFVRAFAFVMAGPENGERACWPYNISSNYRMKKGELCMLELNTQVNGYWSDLTRTWVVGRHPTAEQNDMFDTVIGGIIQALKVVKPGVKTADVDRASRTFIMKSKWGKYHTPFLGHGLGVKLHEPIPMIYPNSPGTLELGHYFTIEPGIYGKGILGALRIERNVWLGPKGPVISDTSPCEL